MAFANVSDLIATTIENRSKKIANNVLKNNALLAKLQASGKVKTVSGGTKIYEEISFAENGNANWYSGYDLLAVAPQDVVSAAEYTIAQAAVPVICSGLELLQNSGKEQMIDLLEARLAVAEDSLKNLVAVGVWSDGTGAGGKQIGGLQKMIPTAYAGTTYGGISRDTWAFWRPQVTTGVLSTNITSKMNTAWAGLVRGADRPDLILMDNAHWGFYVAALQANQRFTDPSTAALGFPSLKFMDADVILDGGIGGACPTNNTFMLNTKFLKFRPHADRNFVPLSPNKRYAINQDAEVQILAVACQMTCNGQQFQGRLTA